MYPAFPCGSTPESACQGFFLYEIPKGLFSLPVLTYTVYEVMNKLGQIISPPSMSFSFIYHEIKLDRNILSNNSESIVNILWIQVLQSLLLLL